MALYPTQSLSTPAIPVMAFQLPNSKISDPSGSSLMASAKSALYCWLCLNATHLTRPCNLVQVKLNKLLINERAASLSGLSSCRTNQPFQQTWRTPDLRRGRVHCLGHLLLWSRVQKLLGHIWQSHLREGTTSPRQKTKDGEKTGRDFQTVRPSSRWRWPWKVHKGHRNKLHYLSHYLPSSR